MLSLKNLLFTLLVPGTVAVYLPLMLTPKGAPDLAPTVVWFRSGALPLFCFGAVVYGWCVWDFARLGRGTPAPVDAPRRLVVRGLYRVVRNPMYVGVLAVILGWASLYSSLTILGYAAGVWGMFQLMISLHEEPALRRRFAEDYEAYASRVPRWMPRWVPQPRRG